MATVSIRNVKKSFGETEVVHGISMEITDGEFVVMVGPSGCGKSTLLRTFNRMYSLYPEQRAEGEIIMDGENLLSAKQDVSLLRARVGMVFQKPTPFPMSIYDNIAFGVRLFERLGKRGMDERVEWALTRAALWDEVKDKLKQSGHGISGGQQQRLCIARAIAIMPDIVLLDIRMPVMNGLEFLRELRKIPGGDAPIVVFCTTENDISHIQTAIEAGANEYIMKPFDSDIIQAKFTQVGLL